MQKLVENTPDLSKPGHMNLKFEIGTGVSTFAEVSDHDEVYVNIGLGFLLKMEPEEAIKYAKIRKKALKREVEHNRKLAVEIKVRIKLVLLALNELNNNAMN
ncbi:hypothetical protein WA026_001138 [Henosepilachna vigintioctopunctata]|uniref:Uncharacterized protein n=1 Tax=Henosepilachna vigintioctopunctata TaxID=420089 RepID=A0AAW1V9C9_9CUCU